MNCKSHTPLVLFFQSHEVNKGLKPGLGLTIPSPGLSDWTSAKLINGVGYNDGDAISNPGSVVATTSEDDGKSCASIGDLFHLLLVALEPILC